MAGESDWKDSLPESVRGWQEVEQSDSPEKFWEQVGNMRSRLGNSVRIPGPDASDDARAEFFDRLTQIEGVTRIPPEDDTEAQAAFYDKIGRPAKPEDYSFEAEDAVKEFYHGLGLTDAQAGRLVESMTEKQKHEHEQLAATVQEQIAALDKEWGDAKQRKLTGIKAVLEKYDPTGELAEVLMNNPQFPHASTLMKVFGNIGDQFLEQSPPDTGASGVWGMTPEEARNRANEMLHNPDSPRNNPNHPNHQSAQEEYMRLRRIATGEAKR